MNALCVFLVSLYNYQRPFIKILDGPIEGTTMKTWNNRDVFAFLGIPYAAPPVGNLRFEPPQKVSPWYRTRDASVFGNNCKQPKSNGSEDCLNLYVYVPMLHGACGVAYINLPVLVFFHGGSFRSGSGAMYGPRYLLDYDMILVTANYRLGSLGFLSSGDTVIPGNNGLKDQAVALNWIRNNIAFFGGDPSRVTIAGGTSVLMHYTSQMSKGLFRSGISFGGSPMRPDAFQKDAKGKFFDYATHFNCDLTDTNKVLSCLKNADANELIDYQESYLGFMAHPISIFGPVVEPIHPNTFFTRYPIESILAGEVANAPLIIGTVNNEGLGITAPLLREPILKYINDNWFGVGPHLLMYGDVEPASYRKTIGELIRIRYFGTGPINSHSFDKFTKLVGDRLFTNDIESSARLFAKACPSPVYLGRFSYRGHDSISSVEKIHGVGHSDDIFYTFNTTGVSAEEIPWDRDMITMMTGIVAKFTIFGWTGVPQWLPLDKQYALEGPVKFLEIASPYSLKMFSGLNLGGEPSFWQTLPVNEPWGGRLPRFTKEH